MGDPSEQTPDLSRRDFLKVVGTAAASPYINELDEIWKKLGGLAKPIPEDDDSKERPARNEVEKMYFEIRQSRQNVDRFFEGIPELEELVILPEQVYGDPIAQVIIFRPALERAMLYELEKTASRYILDLEAQHKMDKATYKEVSELFGKLRDDVESKFTGLDSVFPLMDASLQASYMFQEVVTRWSKWEGIKFNETKNEQHAIFGDALSDILKEYPVPGNVRDKETSTAFGTTNILGNITTSVEFLLAYIESLNDNKPLSQEQKEEAIKAVICHELAHALDLCVNANLIGFMDKADLQRLYVLRLKAFSVNTTIAQMFSDYQRPEQTVSSSDQLTISLAQGKIIADPKQLQRSAISYATGKLENYVNSVRDMTGIYVFFQQCFPDASLPLDAFVTGEWKTQVTRDKYNAQAYDLLDFVLTTYNAEVRSDISNSYEFEDGEMVSVNGNLLLKSDVSFPLLAKSFSGRIVQALFSGDYSGKVSTVLMRSLCIGVPVMADDEYLAEVCGAELLLQQLGTAKDAKSMLRELGKINPYHAYLAEVLVDLGNQEVSAIFDQVVAQVSTAYQVAMANRVDNSVVI